MPRGSTHVARWCWLAPLIALACATTAEDADVPGRSADLGGAPLDPARYCAESLSHPPVPSAETAGLHWAPRVIQRAAITYPRIASLDGREGKVKLRLWIAATGNIDKIDVIESSGWSDLDEAGRQSMRLSRFAPACSSKGEPVAATYVVGQWFSMRGR